MVHAGLTVVVASGNNNGDSCQFSPSFVPAAISVGATDRSDRKAWFSNYGLCTAIWAPGNSILSASNKDDIGTSTKSGTSMACPHVSGGAALVLERNPDYNYAKVLSDLMANAERNAISGLRTGD